ncbi:hypothetical protein S40285_06197 [Stachybotrys chlorohalonatus IBT 40285]|uniref:Uncharacterized protein n=1 Tax=Stachybotrys chlorohalonatus (strain IBT 40285) TaxID=1283841 RepID=A0A084QA64_STAC4|nr:hypothetical protein S40285_06197 [Stachybotrys chlorohalonata IBT 40285]
MDMATPLLAMEDAETGAVLFCPFEQVRSSGNAPGKKFPQATGLELQFRDVIEAAFEHDAPPASIPPLPQTWPASMAGSFGLRKPKPSPNDYPNSFYPDALLVTPSPSPSPRLIWSQPAHPIVMLASSRERQCSVTSQDVPTADDDFTSLMVSSMGSTAFLSISSDPVSSPPSPPSLDRSKSTSFVPPTRPSSTPFPHRSAEYDSDCEPFEDASVTLLGDSLKAPAPASDLGKLPIEVQEAILDHLLGYRVSATSSSAMRMSKARSWSTALRHSRRRELTELALVSRTWRILIQQRLYRHIKLKATIDYLEEAMTHFAQHEHLQPYVRHVEIWFPVFQPTHDPTTMPQNLTLPVVTSDGLTNTTYTLPTNNCTLEEVFRFVSLALPLSRVLTLEGGERRKAPKVVYSHQEDSLLPVLGSVHTLVTKGQWNLMREGRDFIKVFQALPNLVEWQGAYHKPKSKSYITMAEFLPYIPHNITSLTLCLESDYRWEGITPVFYTKVAQKTHICVKMAAALPALEHFSYTGRVCHQFFDTVARLIDPRTTKLQSIDLTVKNCCRQPCNHHDSGSGIQDMSFIEAFEKLVVSGVRSMEKLKQLKHLRIRFMDLDSVLPPLNPYFLMRDGKCSGVWSETIVDEMARVRPGNTFNELNESFGDVVYNKEGRMVITPEYPRTRVTSLKLSNYRSLAARITIQ